MLTYFEKETNYLLKAEGTVKCPLFFSAICEFK